MDLEDTGYQPSERPNQRTAEVRFAEGHEFHGAVIKTTLSASMDFVFSLQNLREETVERQRELMRQFGDSVIREWNVRDRNNNPVPATGEGLLTQEIRFGIDLIIAWLGVVATPNAPLEEPSADTDSKSDG